jgi:hypothetical protein
LTSSDLSCTKPPDGNEKSGLHTYQLPKDDGIMETFDNLYGLDLSVGIAAEEPPSEDSKLCPGLQKFCPHYTSRVCDVKYSECVLLNSLRTSETLLRMERENLAKNPTPKNLELMAQISDVLQDRSQEAAIDPAAIAKSKLKGRVVAGVFLIIILAAAILISLGGA